MSEKEAKPVDPSPSRDVSFSDVRPFLDELAWVHAETDGKEPDCVRVDIDRTRVNDGTETVVLQAGFLHQGSLMELTVNCGKDYLGDSNDGSRKAAEIAKMIFDAADQLGIRVAGGVYES